jgi:hypothetical protein
VYHRIASQQHQGLPHGLLEFLATTMLGSGDLLGTKSCFGKLKILRSSSLDRPGIKDLRGPGLQQRSCFFHLFVI